MSKIVLLLAICCWYLLQIQAQSAAETNANRKTCADLSKSCLDNQRTAGTTDDVTNLVNSKCRISNRNWRNITRCDLERAGCLLTLVECDVLTCSNVAKVLRR